MSQSTAPAATTTRTPLVITSFPSIPLTTTFTPPSDGCGGIYSPPRPNVLIVDHRPSCLPPNFATSDSSFFYSPGVACPSGYWTACHDTAGVSTITTATCCPTYGDISLSCVPRPLSLSSVWETLFCTWQAPQSPGTVIAVTLSSDADRTSTVDQAVTFPGGLNAYGVRMVYQASDMEAAAAASSTTSDESGATGQTPSASYETVTSSASASATGDSSPGLSTGAIVAVSVVVPLIVIGAVVIGWACWWRKMRQRRPQPQPPSSSSFLSPSAPPAAPAYDYSSAPTTATQYPGDHNVAVKHPAEHHYYYSGHPQPQPHEMSAVYEMPSSLQAVELPGPMQDQYPRHLR